MQIDTQSQRKKAFERKILNSVFNSNDYFFVDSESPDFIGTRTSTSEQLGVEVTQYFHSGASARIKNDLKYFQDVLEGKVYNVHKSLLNVIEFTLLSGESKGKSFKGIVHKEVSSDEYLKAIGAIIQEKASRYINFYQIQAKNIDLVILDQENYFNTQNLSTLFGVLYSNIDLVNAISFGGFREIYYLGRLDNTMRYIELRKSLLAYHTVLFHFFYLTIKNDYPTIEQYLLILFLLLEYLGHRNIELIRGENETYVIKNQLVYINLSNHLSPHFANIKYEGPTINILRFKNDYDKYKYLIDKFDHFSIDRFVTVQNPDVFYKTAYLEDINF